MFALKFALKSAGIIIAGVVFVTVVAFVISGATTTECHYEVIREKTISGGMANDYLLITGANVWSVHRDDYARADVGETLHVCDTRVLDVSVAVSYDLVDHQR